MSTPPTGYPWPQAPPPASAYYPPRFPALPTAYRHPLLAPTPPPPPPPPTTSSSTATYNGPSTTVSEDNETASTPLLDTHAPASVQHMIDAHLASALVGCERIIEILEDDNGGENKQSARIECTLCQCRPTEATLIAHITGRQHRYNYFKDVRRDIYDEFIVNLQHDRHKQIEMLALKAEEIEAKEGRGQVVQKQRIKDAEQLRQMIRQKTSQITTSLLGAPPKPSTSSPLMPTPTSTADAPTTAKKARYTPPLPSSATPTDTGKATNALDAPMSRNITLRKMLKRIAESSIETEEDAKYAEAICAALTTAINKYRVTADLKNALSTIKAVPKNEVGPATTSANDDITVDPQSMIKELFKLSQHVSVDTASPSTSSSARRPLLSTTTAAATGGGMSTASTASAAMGVDAQMWAADVGLMSRRSTGLLADVPDTGTSRSLLSQPIKQGNGLLSNPVPPTAGGLLDRRAPLVGGENLMANMPTHRRASLLDRDQGEAANGGRALLSTQPIFPSSASSTASRRNGPSVW